MRQGAVRIGAGQQHQDVGPRGEGAPGLHPVDRPAALDAAGRGDDVGHVRAVVGLGDRHRGQHLGRGQLRQPLLLLRFGSPVDQRPGEDLRPGDEGAAETEGAPAQLLGGHHHAHVVALATAGEAVVLLGDRQPEAPQLGQPLDDLLGDVPVGPVDVLGMGSHLVLGEAVEGLTHQLEVVAQVPWPLHRGQAGQTPRDRAVRSGTPPPERSIRPRLPRPPRARPPGPPGRPPRRPRTPGPGAPRSHRALRTPSAARAVATAAAAWATS